MKKVIISALLCLFGMGVAMATETAYVGIKLTVANSLSYSRVRLTENSERHNYFEDGYDAALMNLNPTNSTNVFLFAIEGDAYCSSVYYKNLDNLPLGFKTNLNETQYTLTFTTVEGRALVLYDKVENVTTNIVENGTYNFTAEAGQKVVLDRFVINPTYTVTTNANGWATYSNSLDLVAEAAPAGVTEPNIYSAEYDGAETLALTERDGVKANTGVVVWGDPSTTYTLVPGTVTTYTSGLTASVTETTVDAAKTNYCLTTINGVSAFYEYTGAKVSANKAYLAVGGTAAPKRIRMVVNGTTDVENVEAEVTTEKVYQNGQLLIKKGDQLYNLQGQIVK